MYLKAYFMDQVEVGLAILCLILVCKKFLSWKLNYLEV